MRQLVWLDLRPLHAAGDDVAVEAGEGEPGTTVQPGALHTAVAASGQVGGQLWGRGVESSKDIKTESYTC